MAAQGNSLASRISRWELLERTIAPLVQEMPHLAASHAELQQMIAAAKQLEVQFEQTRASSRAFRKERVALFQQGDELRARLGAALQFHHGFRSDKLSEFGLKPRRVRGAARQVKPEPTPPPTLPPPTTGGPAEGGGSQQT
jgi:hypothetical protein